MPNDRNSTLHTLNKTAQHDSLNLKLSQTISEGDAVILIEDGVYQCLNIFSDHKPQNNPSWPNVSKSIYALKDDALARGIQSSVEGIVCHT